MSNIVGRSGYEDWHKPIDWLASLQQEPSDVTDQKIKAARELEVPALLFTADQVHQRYDELARLEMNRYDNPTYHNVLYILLLQGGAGVSQEYFRRIGARVPGHKIDQDSYAIRFHERFAGSEVTVTKPAKEGTRLTGRPVVLLDSAVGHGRTARTVLEQFTDPTWTVNHHMGNVAREVGLRTLTMRADADLRGFDEQNVDVGFITPPNGVKTAGSASDDQKGAHRWSEGIFLAAQQPIGARESVAKTLELLGERAVMTIDQIEWIDQQF